MTTESTLIDTHYTSSGSSPPTILDAAIDWSRRGFRVVPLNPRRRDPWLEYCKPGYKDLPPPTESDIRGWFAIEPNLNIGIHLGNGFIALDIDEKPGKASGSEALRHLEELHGALPVTLTSITGTGQHRIFRLPPGYDFGDSLPVIKAWLLATTGKATGGVIDVKGTGYIAAPPSIHPDGPQYRWLDPDAEIATLPLAWCQEPVALPFDDPERPRRGKSRQASRLKAKDLSDLDRLATERMANVDADALLGKDTLLLLGAEVEKSTDRSHRMWRIILGAASVRFDPDALYIRLLNSPLEAGLREHGGREWFDRQFFKAHQYLAEKILAVEELRTEIKDYEWTTTPYMTKNGRISKAAPESMKVVLHDALDEAVRQATTEPLLVKSKMAVTLGISRKTIVKAFGGLIALGRLEVVPEPGRKYDDPAIYRLLPAEARSAALMHPCSSLDAKTQDTAVLSSTLSTPSTPYTPSTVSRCNPHGLEASKDLLSGSRDTLLAPTREHAAEVLRNFSDDPEPPRTKKRTDPWATHACRKCGQPTLTMRDTDPESNRVFRVDAQPSPVGNWIVVDDRWQVLQAEGRTNHERNHDETDRNYYAWHTCPTTPPNGDQHVAPVHQQPGAPNAEVEALRFANILLSPEPDSSASMVRCPMNF